MMMRERTTADEKRVAGWLANIKRACARTKRKAEALEAKEDNEQAAQVEERRARERARAERGADGSRLAPMD